MLNEFHEPLYIRRCHLEGDSWKFRENDRKAEVNFVARRIPQIVYYAAMHQSIYILQRIPNKLGLLMFV